MRELLLLLLFPGLTTAKAQITIGQSDMPSAGDTMRYRNTPAADVDLSLTGPGVLWDFGALVPEAAGADTAVSVSSTPFAFQFFFNNPFLYPDHDADLATKGQDFGFQTFLTVSNLYDYYRRDVDGYLNVGFGANINGLPTSVRRIPIDVIHRFPMAFGDVDSSFSSFELNVPTVFSFQQDQWRYNTVDGWGTLYLPADTFQVLRVRSVLQRSDTVFVEQFGFGLRFEEPLTEEYRWIAQGMDQPVLQVTVVGGQPSTARFVYSPDEVVAITDPHRGAPAIVLYPNPADERIIVRTGIVTNGVLDLFDATGRTVRSGIPVRPEGDTVIAVDDLVAGVYTVRLAGSRPWAGRIVVQH